MNRSYRIIVLLCLLPNYISKGMESVPMDHTFCIPQLTDVPEDAQQLLFSPHNQKWWYCSSPRKSHYNSDYYDTIFQKVHSFNHHTAFLCFERKTVLIHGNLTHEHIWFKHNSAINTACFNDDYVAIGSQDTHAHIFDMGTKEKLISFSHPHSVTTVALHENLLATASHKFAYVFDIKCKENILSLVYDDEINDIKFNKNILTIASGQHVYLIDINTGIQISFLSLNDPILSAYWCNNQLQVISQDKWNRQFMAYNTPTLDQLKLKWALNFWLLLEKPDQSILQKEYPFDFIPSLLTDVITKCNLPYTATMIAWNTLPLDLQVALFTTMKRRIKKHGKVVKEIIFTQKPFITIQKPSKKKICSIQ